MQFKIQLIFLITLLFMSHELFVKSLKKNDKYKKLCWSLVFDKIVKKLLLVFFNKL